jgi:hypothetical protein
MLVPKVLKVFREQ